MPVNLELKARIPSVQRAIVTVREAGGVDHGLLVQRDTYFLVQKGRLKLREFGDGSAELIYYEREESTEERRSVFTRVPVQESGELRRVLGESIGIKTEVRKRRMLYMLFGARIHLDTVEGLGEFVEFEVPEAGEEQPDRVMTRLRSILSIRREDIFWGSYADLMITAGENNSGAREAKTQA